MRTTFERDLQFGPANRCRSFVRIVPESENWLGGRDGPAAKVKQAALAGLAK